MRRKVVDVPAGLVPGPQTAALVLRQITEFPETYDQNRWMDSCYTQGCVAGWAAAFHPAILEAHISTYDCGDSGCEEVYTNWEEAGRQALGLGHHDAMMLFAGHRETSEVIAALEFVAAGKAIDWHSLPVPKKD